MGLTVVYGREEPPESFEQAIFLIGPSPREVGVVSWRPEALELLREMGLGYEGIVFVPEPRGIRQADLGPDGYLDQVGWEARCMNMADVILCWLPRDHQTMPGYTTNVEFGMWIDSGKLVFGGPEGAFKNRYLIHHAQERKVPVATTLRGTVLSALALLGEGARREGGEREVPLLVWRSPYFQRWYAGQRRAGNVLEHARLVWTHRVGPDRQTVFFWVLWAEVYITAEGRRKSNEVLLSRPDISAVVLHGPRQPSINDTAVALVEEFRTAGGHVWEPPGGSSRTDKDPLTVGVEEVLQETGLAIDPSRFVDHGSWPIQATLSVQACRLFSVELTQAEIDQIQQDERDGVIHGVEADTERTKIHIKTLGEIRTEGRVDLSMMGCLLQVLA